jgi:hypothetical protein
MYRHVLALAVVGLSCCAGAAFAQDADTVDGFDAYGMPHANALLALDGASHFPISVIPDNSITGGKLAPGAVTAGRLADNAVTASKIVSGAVTTAKLAYGAVTAGRLADNSVTSSKITNGTILGEDVRIPLLMGGSRDGYLIGCFNGSSGSSSSGITGYSTAASGSTRGVVGACNSPDGIGVFGVAKDVTGANYGVYGLTNSSNGYGLCGWSPYCGVYGYCQPASGTAYGVFGKCASASGLGLYGLASAETGTNYGVYGETLSDSGYGVYSEGDCEVAGDLTVTGSKTGYVVDVVLNGGDEPLYPGDLVEIISYSEPVVGRIPVAVVCKTTVAESRAVLGPIDSAVSVTPTEASDDPPVSGDDPVLYNVKRAEGAIAPGEYGRVVTVGLYERIKVDASDGPIYPGDLLVSSSTPGHAMASDDPGVGTVVGKALGSLESGMGEIPVFVSSK